MAIPQKLRRLFGTTTYNVTIAGGADTYIGSLNARQLYATQANLHAVISFLSDSISQLPLNVYERVGEYDRRRDRDSIAAQLLRYPNPDQTTCEFINSSLIEYYLFGVSTWWKLPDPDSQSGWQLRLIPREWVIDSTNDINYAPNSLIIQAGQSSQVVLKADEFIQFKMYNPGNPAGFQSPLQSLKQTLREQIEADRYRTEIWRSSGRMNAYITRPKDVEPFTDEQRKKFIEAFREAWAAGGENAGKMPLLEDGMEIKPYTFNAKEAQYAESKQLSREDVAAAYHVNPSLIWHTDTQTYASAKDNARALYADCLGPTIQMMQQRINSFLIPSLGLSDRYYVEFDLTEKLKGSFEERASIMQSAVGGPWLTRDEARAEDNRPPLPDGQGAQVITPLNVTVGGLAAPNDTDPTVTRYNAIKSVKSDKREPIKIKAQADEDDEQILEDIFSSYFKRQAASILPKLGSKAYPDWWDADRWNKELAEDLYPAFLEITTKHGTATAETIGWEYNSKQTHAYLQKLAAGKASGINKWTLRKIEKAIEEGRPVSEVYEILENSETQRLSVSIGTSISAWAVLEAASQYSYATGNDSITKTWIHNPSENPRVDHIGMNGETVPLDDLFSNGVEWPGEWGGRPDQTAYCHCTVEVTVN